MKQLESVFLEHQRSLFAAALAITRNKAAAEDCVFDALAAVAALKEAPRNMAAYLFRVVRNKALHNLKQSQRQQAFDEDYLDAEPGNQELETLLGQVKQHIGSLVADEQQVLILKLFEDMTFDEIARIMEASPNTVASWYRRGLEKLKHAMGEENE